jgi:hypothetical protein
MNEKKTALLHLGILKTILRRNSFSLNSYLYLDAELKKLHDYCKKNIIELPKTQEKEPNEPT